MAADLESFPVRSIYLDYNATTPLAPIAQEAMLPYLADRFADPSSDYADGHGTREAIEDARTRVAAAIGASADEIIWTSGGTEASNLALRGLIEPSIRAGEKPHLIVSAVDHPAVQGPARFLERCGAELTVVSVDRQGLVDPEAIAEALRPTTRLVSIVAANEDLGTIQPLLEIATLCRAEGVLCHTDASLALGKIPLSVSELDVDLVSLSAHKTYGPKGVGALYVRRGIGLEAQLWGDGHEHGQRAGMPNVAGVVGFGAVMGVVTDDYREANERIEKLKDRLATRLTEAVAAKRYGPANRADQLAGTLCIALPGVAAADLLCATPEVCAMPCTGGGISNGAVSAISLNPTLRAIGADPTEAAGAIRLSVGWYTDEADIDAAADALLAGWESLSE